MDVNTLSIEGLKIMLILAIIVLTAAIGLIGYFMSRRDSAISIATDNLVIAVNQLRQIVNTLQTQYEIRQPIVDDQLKVHNYRLELHNDRILKLETEHNYLHCKYPEGNEPKE